MLIKTVHFLKGRHPEGCSLLRELYYYWKLTLYATPPIADQDLCSSGQSVRNNEWRVSIQLFLGLRHFNDSRLLVLWDRCFPDTNQLRCNPITHLINHLMPDLAGSFKCVKMCHWRVLDNVTKYVMVEPRVNEQAGTTWELQLEIHGGYFGNYWFGQRGRLLGGDYVWGSVCVENTSRMPKNPIPAKTEWID